MFRGELLDVYPEAELPVVVKKVPFCLQSCTCFAHVEQLTSARLQQHIKRSLAVYKAGQAKLGSELFSLI